MTSKISVPTSAFRSAVDIVSKSVAKTTPLPVLKNIMFSVNDNKIVLLSTDMVMLSEATISINSPFDIDTFSVLVDADKLVKFIAALDTDSISIEPYLDNNKIILRSKGRKAEFQIISSNEFVETGFQEPNQRMDISPYMFCNAVKNVSGYHLPFNDPQLSVFRGVDLHISPDGVMAVATDTIIGAVAKYGDDFNKKNAYHLIVAGDHLGDVAKSVSKFEELSIGIPGKGDKKFWLYGSVGSVDAKIAIQSLSDQIQFPDLMEYILGILKDNLLCEVKIDSSELSNSLKPMGAYDTTQVLVTVKTDSIELSISDDVGGSYVATVDCIVENYIPDLRFIVTKKNLAKSLSNLEYMSMKTNGKIPLVVLSNIGNENYYQAIGKMFV